MHRGPLAGTVSIRDRPHPCAGPGSGGLRGPIVGHLDVLDERGTPRVRAGEEAAPGLRFVGFTRPPALLGTLGAEARTAAKGIAGQSPASRRAPFPALRRPAPAASG